MTTVVYRDGVMAADRTSQSGNIRSVAQKIYRVDETLIGFSGNAADCHVFLEWWRAGRDKERLPEFRIYRHDGSDAPDLTALVLSPRGVEIWTEHFQSHMVLNPFWAIGSGAKAAMAAMYMGGDAARAVEVASLVDIYTSGDIQVEKLETGTTTARTGW